MGQGRDFLVDIQVLNQLVFDATRTSNKYLKEEDESIKLIKMKLWEFATNFVGRRGTDATGRFAI